MSHLTIKQRSALVQAAERGLYREPEGNEGDYLLAAVGFIGCALILIFRLLGVVS